MAKRGSQHVESGGKGTMLIAADSWGMGLSSEFGLKNSGRRPWLVVGGPVGEQSEPLLIFQSSRLR